MSAFVVDKAHINALILSGLAVQYKPLTWYHNGKPHTLTDDNASEVGQMLLEECIRSVSSRYEGSKLTDLPGRSDAEYIIPFQFKQAYNPPTPVEALKLIYCYEYQSCETDDWEKTQAYAFCRSLTHNTIDRLPGYEEAPWECTEWPKETLHRLV